MWWAFGGAAVAAVAYGTATILQALSVRRLAAVASDAPAGSRFKAGRLYAVGLALDALGFLASVAALRRLPLFLVESAVASSVAVTAGLAVLVLGVHLKRTELAALAVTRTVLGLVLLAVSARDGTAQHAGPVAGWLLLGSAVGVTLFLLTGLRMADQTAASIVLATASGLGFGIVGISARTLQLRTPWWHTAADPILWAIAAHGAVAAVAYGLALHRGRTTTVAAITFAVETVLPASIGLAFLGDAVRQHLVPVAAVGFLATVGGSILLSAHADQDQVEVINAG